MNSRFATSFHYKSEDRLGGSLAEPFPLKVHAAHSCVSGERNEISLAFRNVAPSKAVLFFSQNDDRSAFGSFVREAGELRCVGQLLCAYAAHRKEFHRLTVAEGDCSGLVQ